MGSEESVLKAVVGRKSEMSVFEAESEDVGSDVAYDRVLERVILKRRGVFVDW